MMSGPLFAMVTQRASFIGLPKIIKRIGRLTWWKCGDFVLHLNWSSHCIVWTDEIHLVGTNFWGCGSGFGCGGASELCQFLRWQATKTKKIEKTSTMTRIFSAWSFARTRQNPRFESASFHLVATQSSRCKKKREDLVKRRPWEKVQLKLSANHFNINPSVRSMGNRNYCCRPCQGQ